MKVISTSLIYENPLPQLVSKQSMFPSLCELPDGRLAALGYAYIRSNPDLPIGNPETGGIT